MKPLSRISSAQYSPRRQSRWVLADYGGKDLWKRRVLSLEWNSECVIDGESGEQVGGEFLSVGRAICSLHFTNMSVCNVSVWWV